MSSPKSAWTWWKPCSLLILLLDLSLLSCLKSLISKIVTWMLSEWLMEIWISGFQLTPNPQLWRGRTKKQIDYRAMSDHKSSLISSSLLRVFFKCEDPHFSPAVAITRPRCRIYRDRICLSKVVGAVGSAPVTSSSFWMCSQVICRRPRTSWVAKHRIMCHKPLLFKMAF